MMVVELQNGTIFEVTPDHRFLTKGEWREIQELYPGDELENIVGEPVAIKNTGSITRSAVVYNFSVWDNENYFVTEEGVLVHNASYNEPAIFL
ncbi:Hint domain-containing protein [Mucilaginibacter sp.]|uniref:Hint domain-containing protein n=1 Tax=Mucilaginibacter sp. TaxID=1882438 RepID=UPI002622E1E3|nr:Hint domain-containing protein [Mucilaginibacter sp.]MDB4919071.1 Hedgehog/intein hint domain protein [Mucilaginibacter sp.]